MKRDISLTDADPASLLKGTMAGENTIPEIGLGDRAGPGNSTVACHSTRFGHVGRVNDGPTSAQ